MKYLFTTILFTATLLLNGCGGAAPSVKAQQAAAQAVSMEVPGDTARYYYALGEAETMELAKNNALGDIASRISVSISASLDAKVSVDRFDDQEHISKNVTSNINAQAKTVEFSGVSVEASQTLEDLKRVVVKVDREVLVQSYRKKLQRVDKKIANEMSIIASSSVFSQLKLSYGVEKLMAQAREHVALLQAMKPAFDGSAHSDTYAKNSDALRAMKDKAIFSVETDKNSQTLATLIKSHASQNSIKMGNKEANVKLYISTTIKEKKYKSASAKFSKLKIVMRTTTLKVVDASGVVISNRVIKTKAASSISKEDAIAQTKQYEKLLNKEGLIGFISGNE